MEEMKEDIQKIQSLLVTHLGPIEKLSQEEEDALIEVLMKIEYPNGRNVSKALSDNNIKITNRQLKPYKDFLILGHLTGCDKSTLPAYIKSRVKEDAYPGAIVKIV